MTEMHNGYEEQQREVQAWDAHLRSLIYNEHEAMMEIVAGAIAELQREAKVEVAKAMREAALEALPKASVERDRIAKAIVDATDRLREDIRAEMRAGIRIAVLEQLAPRVKGTWVEGETYQALDIVAADGTIFLAKVSSPGRCPGPDWQLVSHRGERGPKGERGPAGPAAPTIVSWQIDCASFTASPILSDGSEGPPLELRGLFEQYYAETG